jgi:integrase
MPRPWYRRSRGEWYANVNNKQVPLGVTDPAALGAAWSALQQLISDVSEVKAAVLPAGRGGTVAELVPAFLDERRATVEPRTVRGYAQHLKWLREEYGRQTPGGLDLAELVRRAARVESWGDTHRANVLGTVGAFLKWCGVGGKIPLPPKASRGADSVIPEPVYHRCLDESRGDFRQILRFLWHTGCRPGEATSLTADVVNWESGTIRLKEHKTRKKGKTRVIYPPAEAIEVLREQHEKYAAGGLLFRGIRGRRLSMQAMTMRFARLGEKVGRPLRSYDFRHTWATRALAAGVPAAHVAAMLGHATTAMVFRHYGHLTEEAKLLKEQAERVAGRKAG